MKGADDLPIEFLTEFVASKMTEPNPFSGIQVGLWNRLYIAKRLLPPSFDDPIYPNKGDEFADYIDNDKERYLNVKRAINLAKHITGCQDFDWEQAMLIFNNNVPLADMYSRKKDEIDFTVFPIIAYDAFWSILENHLYESHHIKRDCNYDYEKMPEKGNGIPDPMDLYDLKTYPLR